MSAELSEFEKLLNDKKMIKKTQEENIKKYRDEQETFKKEAFEKLGTSYPIIIGRLDGEYNRIIKEALPHLKFTLPYKVATLSDGKTYAKEIKQKKEIKADTKYAIFITLYEHYELNHNYDKDYKCANGMLIFENGLVSFSRPSNDLYANYDSFSLRIPNHYLKNPKLLQDRLLDCAATHPEGDKKFQDSGCYVATAVYGSYDCPEVWTLRRFRDYQLAKTWCGRLFVHTYYAISPTLVKWFGNTEWFKNIFKPILDKMIDILQEKGVENTPYQDRNW